MGLYDKADESTIVNPRATIFYPNNTTWYLNDFIYYQIIETGGIFYPYSNNDVWNPNQQQMQFKFYFEDNNLTTENINLIYPRQPQQQQYTITITDTNGQVATYMDNEDNNVINADKIRGLNPNFGQIISEIKIISNGYSGGKITTSNDYGLAYNAGMQRQKAINEEQNEVSKISYENKIQELYQEIENQKRQYEGQMESNYNAGYNNGYQAGQANTNVLYNMVIAVADTPVGIFKQIFNFDILGINIAGAVFGIISILLIVWIIKKII